MSAEIPSGMILLEAGQANIVTGATIPARLSLHDANGFPVLGYWIEAADSATWQAPVPVSGSYRLLVESGNAPGTGTNLVRFSSGNAGLQWSPKATLAWDDIQVFALEGTLRLEQGLQTLRLDVLQRPAGAVMNLRSIALVPEKNSLETARAWLLERSATRLLAWQNIQEAVKLRAGGKKSDALAMSEEAVKAAPTWGESWHSLARDLAALEKNDRARDAYKTAMLYKSADPWVVADAAGCEAGVGRYAEGIILARQALERFEAKKIPVPPWFSYNCGVWAGGYQKPPDPESALFFFRYTAEKAQADAGLQDAARQQIVHQLRNMRDWPAYESALSEFFITNGSNRLKGGLAQAEASRLEELEADEALFLPWYRRAVEYFLLEAAILGKLAKADKSAIAEAHRNASINLNYLLDRRGAWVEADLARQWAPENPGIRDHFLFHTLEYANERFGTGDFPACIELCTQGLAASPPENEDMAIWFSLLGSLAKSESERLAGKPQVVHTVMVFLIPQSFFNSRSGMADRLSVDDLAVSERFLSRFWEAVSGGRFTLRFDHKTLDTAVVSALCAVSQDKPVTASGNIQLDAIGIDQKALEASLSQQYDTFMYYWNSLHAPTVAVGGMSGRGRGIVTMPLTYARTNGDRIMLHEFWHVFQCLVDLGPAHTWIVENRNIAKAWLPSWTGSTEISWYREVLEKRLAAALEKACAEKKIIGWQPMRFIRE